MNLQNTQGMTIFMIAAERGNLSIFRKCVEKGAKLKMKDHL